MTSGSQLERIVGDTVAAFLPHGRLRHVRVEPYINSVDEEGLRVTAVLGNDDPSPVGGREFLDMLLAISDRLHTAGETRVATLIVATEDELAHSGDPDA